MFSLTYYIVLLIGMMHGVYGIATPVEFGSQGLNWETGGLFGLGMAFQRGLEACLIPVGMFVLHRADF